MRVLPLLALALAAPLAGAATPHELEKDVVRTAALRDARLAEARRLQAEAAAAADQIAALEGPSPGMVRAGGELGRRLREFDRLAGGLEKLERELAGLEARLVRSRAAFDSAADAEERRLEGEARRQGPAAIASSIASSIEALRDARRRVATLAAAPGFRPPLEVVLSPLDGPAELEAKLAVIHGERARVGARLAEIRRDVALLATRHEAKREWARQLAAARRDAAGSLDLLDRGDEDARAALRDLADRMAALAREKAALEEAETRLQGRRAEAEGRLAELRKGR